MTKRAEHLCYTDGSAKVGPGAPGGWGYCIVPPEGPQLEGYGKAHGTLAKIMEYRAVAEALAVLPEASLVRVFSDNESLVKNLARGKRATSRRSTRSSWTARAASPHPSERGGCA